MGIEGVSYGGQLTDWLITQTNEFKAAIPTASIANLVSYNYMTYYNQTRRWSLDNSCIKET